MVLERIITKERIMLDISDIDKWTAIEDLAELIVTTVTGSDREVLLNDVISREEKASTGIGKGIAIPHARTSGVPTTVGALGISREGIDFESDDGKPCHLIFLIIAPQQESTKYLKALSEVAAIAKDADRIKRLVGATTPDEAMAVLGEAKGTGY